MLILLLPVLSVAQINAPIIPKNINVKGLPPGVDSVAVKYARLMKIARKYSVDKNFTFKPSLTNTSGSPPQTVYLKMSIAQFEDWMKRLGFHERKVQILNQFYLKDFQKVCTVEEYIALRRAYAKKYRAYLQDEASFQEARIQQEEAHADLINLNTPGFRKKHP